MNEARAAIVARNFGEAVLRASEAVDADPHDPAAHYELARAEALQGNEGRALQALRTAVDKGLADPSRALADPAFDQLQGNPEFAALEERASPMRQATRSAQSQRPEQPDEPAVEIRENGGREVIRAGDVVIDTDL
ncbi:hypothetical protein GCM10022280_18950 [Sphingomonas swuensis]|uniref:Tetratricopeptide repeat protein n=1 Tax=Sphingomonas swuensis TaxID=977800 RepID=A0ABP7T0V6_9SPHN